MDVGGGCDKPGRLAKVRILSSDRWRGPGMLAELVGRSAGDGEFGTEPMGVLAIKSEGV